MYEIRNEKISRRMTLDETCKALEQFLPQWKVKPQHAQETLEVEVTFPLNGAVVVKQIFLEGDILRQLRDAIDDIMMYYVKHVRKQRVLHRVESKEV